MWRHYVIPNAWHATAREDQPRINNSLQFEYIGSCDGRKSTGRQPFANLLQRRPIPPSRHPPFVWSRSTQTQPQTQTQAQQLTSWKIMYLSSFSTEKMRRSSCTAEYWWSISSCATAAIPSRLCCSRKPENGERSAQGAGGSLRLDSWICFFKTRGYWTPNFETLVTSPHEHRRLPVRRVGGSGSISYVTRMPASGMDLSTPMPVNGSSRFRGL